VAVSALLARLSALAVIGIALAGAMPGGPNLFPQPQITTEQWQTLRAKVKATPGAQDVSRPAQPDVEAVAIPEERVAYYFTTGGPAHPAVGACRFVDNAARCEVYFVTANGEATKWFISAVIPLLAPKPDP